MVIGGAENHLQANGGLLGPQVGEAQELLPEGHGPHLRGVQSLPHRRAEGGHL